MASRYLTIILLLASFNLKCFPQYAADDDSLRLIISIYGQAHVTVPNTGGNVPDLLTRKVSVTSVTGKDIFITLSPLTSEWFINQGFNYRIFMPSLQKGVLTARNVNEAMQWEKYPSWTQYDSIMHIFANDYPSLCRLDTIGTSINGKLILALKISDNPLSDEDEPAVFYTSTMHGDETAGYVTMLHFIDYILKNYNTDDRIRNMADNLETWINPLSNPDGTYPSRDTIYNPVRFNANGYDLNRNYPDITLADPDPLQKETSDMILFMKKHNFVLSANFHSGEEVVNYPWDRWNRLHADDSWFHDISRAYADTVHKYSGPGYMYALDNGVTRGSEWYVIHGSRQDFVTYSLHGREVTIELDRQFVYPSYVTPEGRLGDLWAYNRNSLCGYLENALFGIHGKVVNAVTSLPVKALISVERHDLDSSQVYSGSEDGRYVRMIGTGTWNITFSAQGYSDTTITGVTSEQYRLTSLNVSLKPVREIIDKDEFLLYPVPAHEELTALLPNDISGIFNVRIISVSGTLIMNFPTEVKKGEPVRIKLRHVAPGTYSIVFTGTSGKIICKGKFIHIN